jgi:hypothetical protein
MCGFVATRSPSNAIGYNKMMDLGSIPFEGIMIYSLVASCDYVDLWHFVNFVCFCHVGHLQLQLSKI